MPKATLSSKRTLTVPHFDLFQIVAKHFDIPGVEGLQSDDVVVEQVEDFGNHHFTFTYNDERLFDE